MKHIILACLASVAFGSAHASEFNTGDSYGPRGRAYSAGQPVPASPAATPCRADTDGIQAPSCGPVAGAAWAPFPPVSLSAAELSAQRAASTAARRESYDQIIRGGGCEADFLPVDYAAHCWPGSVNSGGLGGSSGGSDN